MTNKKKPQGRPVSEHETQSERLQVLVTETEFKAIKAQAHGVKKTVSAFCREVILKGLWAKWK